MVGRFNSLKPFVAQRTPPRAGRGCNDCGSSIRWHQPATDDAFVVNSAAVAVIVFSSTIVPQMLSLPRSKTKRKHSRIMISDTVHRSAYTSLVWMEEGRL